jgi:hypothetical protein
MSPIKSPLEKVKEAGGKDKLVEKIMGMIDRGAEEGDALKARLLTASNKQLLRLAKVSETVRSKYGSTEKLAESVATAMGRAKDADYVRRLGEYMPARLLDMAQALARRAGSAAKVEAQRATSAVTKTAAKGAAKAKTVAAKAKTAIKKK